MPSDNYQLVALPISEYLQNYLCGKLKVEPITIKGGSKATQIAITKRSFFGELIITNLKPSKSFNKNQSSFYIKISDQASNRTPGIPDTRNTIVKLPESKCIIIEKLLRSSLESELVAHIDGAIYAHNKAHGTKKGIAHDCIYNFMEKNGLPFSSSMFETLKKIYYRAKKTAKPFKTLAV